MKNDILSNAKRAMSKLIRKDANYKKPGTREAGEFAMLQAIIFDHGGTLPHR